MCLCWNFDKQGKVTGMCGMEELRRRIHDPDYMPEIKALRTKLAEHDAWVKRDALPENQKQDIAQWWIEHLNNMNPFFN